MEGLEAIETTIGRPSLTISPLMQVLMSERPRVMQEDSYDVKEDVHGVNISPELGKLRLKCFHQLLFVIIQITAMFI